MNSRGAATECSPGREPGVFFRHDLSPGGAKESFGVFRSFGAAFPNDTYPGLAPGATLCRRSAAEYSTGFSPSSLRKFPRPQSQLGQICRCKEGMRFSSLQHYFSLFLSARRTSTWLRPERSLRLRRHGLRSSDVKSGTLD